MVKMVKMVNMVKMVQMVKWCRWYRWYSTGYPGVRAPAISKPKQALLTSTIYRR